MEWKNKLEGVEGVEGVERAGEIDQGCVLYCTQKCLLGTLQCTGAYLDVQVYRVCTGTV